MTNQKKSDFGRGAFIAHDRVQLKCEDATRAKQAMAAECNINNIMEKYLKTGLIDHVNEHKGQYGDLPSAMDYHDSCNAVIAAKDAFASLPSNIRNKFDNDPGKFLEFAQNPENEDQMGELGLVDKPSTREPKEVAPSDVTVPERPLEEPI